MSKSAAFTFARLAARLMVAGVAGAWLAGCSSDVTRLSESPFSNPFSSASNDQPASGPVASASPNANYAAAAHPSPVAVSALPAPAPATTGAIKPSAPQPVTGFGNGWSAAGGTPIVVADGETLDTVSQRYGVPTSALLQANGFTSPAQVHPGVRLIVPVYNAAGGKVATAEKKAHDAEDSSSTKSKREKEKDKKDKVAKEPAKDKAEKRADAEDAHKKDHDKDKSKVADAKTETAKDKRDAKADAKSDKTAKSNETNVAKADGAPAKKPAADQTPTGSLRPEEPASSEAPLTGAQADAAGTTPEFRWPARGRIIQGFAAGGNDGINIAVPEGTSVKAAESGVVAYAGNELKGYGNLILIRHPNGFVTAYANNKELEVKRGDTVKRGQIIAKSGQSGNVSTPQLHFELRKGSTPVDPTSYLAGL
ncbi:MAG TPA: peptidoglycan DD-metalloendopeptidase family protein [Roseiarcus sp.]|nr:peptidoglycan DD-metalloendopeptidase family protein [Roseiarcus sp.]